VLRGHRSPYDPVTRGASKLSPACGVCGRINRITHQAQSLHRTGGRVGNVDHSNSFYKFVLTQISRLHATNVFPEVYCADGAEVI
jgi:hypothetical protein